MVGGDPYCCELLLHDHAQVGCVDENGWQEIHQVNNWVSCIGLILMWFSQNFVRFFNTRQYWKLHLHIHTLMMHFFEYGRNTNRYSLNFQISP